MTTNADDPRDLLRTLWTADDEQEAALDEDCSPTRVCRNAREFSFEGIAEDGADLATAWREKLEREGKLSTSGESLRELVFGQVSSD